MDCDEIFGTGTALKSCNLINPRWLERIKIQRGPVRQSVLHLASCDFPDSYEAVSFLCPWLRFDQESLIYDVLRRLIRGDDGPCVCFLCRSQSLLEYVDFSLCVSVSSLKTLYNLCSNSVTFMGCLDSKTHNSVVFSCKIEIQFIFISSTKRPRLEAVKVVPLTTDDVTFSPHKSLLDT